jgi:hypothetical protein
MTTQKNESPQALVKRDEKGRFVKGASGNPVGRPLGSKNKVNLIKISMEQEFRDGNFEKIAQILNSVVDEALEGDKQARKMVWDACISKASLSEDKDTKGDAPQILIRHMEVQKQGDIIDVEPIEEEDYE